MNCQLTQTSYNTNAISTHHECSVQNMSLKTAVLAYLLSVRGLYWSVLPKKQ